MRYVVFIQDLAFPGEWLDVANFRWHFDAEDFARSLSKRDRHQRLVRIEGSSQYAEVLFRGGKVLENAE